MTTKFGVELDFETADRILVCALKEHYEYIKKDIEEVDEMTNLVTDAQAIAHVENLRTLTAMKLVLGYFGEKV
jgi:hypothetical protein